MQKYSTCLSVLKSSTGLANKSMSVFKTDTVTVDNFINILDYILKTLLIYGLKLLF